MYGTAASPITLISMMPGVPVTSAPRVPFPGLRWKLADFLIAEYIRFPERPAYPTVTSVMNPCALLERAPAAYGIHDTVLALSRCDAGCADPLNDDDDTAGRDRSDM